MTSRTVSLVAAGLLVATIATPALAQKAKDTLRYPLAEAAAELDPYLVAGGVFNSEWSPSVFDNLVMFDPGKGDFVSMLAKSWTQPNDTTYEFELFEDIKWQDGQNLTADDVVYTLNYLIDPAVTLRYKANWNWIASVEKLGPYKVRVTSKSPQPEGLLTLATSTPIFPKHIHGALADKGDFGAKPVGTGPLRIAKIDKNAGLVAERNPYFIAKPAKFAAPIARIVAEPVLDQGTLIAKMLRGDADLARDLPGDQAVALRDSGNFEFTVSPPALGYSFIGFPTKGAANVPALGDVRVRTAIIKAINRPVVVEAEYGEVAKNIAPVEGLCSKEQLGCGYTKMVPAYDPEGAKKLLAEAGYKDGFDVTLSTFPNNVTEATAVVGMLRAVGIRANVRTHTVGQRVQMLSQGKVDISYYGWSGGSMFGVTGQLVRHFLSKEYDDPELVKMAQTSSGMMNDAERRKAVAKLMDYAHDQAYLFPMLPTRVIFTHSKDLKLLATGLRAGQVHPHEFGWK